MKNKKPAIILLAEDDPADQELTRRALVEGKVDNELYIVNDGEETLDYLLRKNQYADPETSPYPDLLLLDLNMPKVDGREVLEEMQKHPHLKYIRTIVLTTSKQEEDILRSYNLGINSYITKPIVLDDFFRTIATLQEYWLQIVKLPPKKGS